MMFSTEICKRLLACRKEKAVTVDFRGWVNFVPKFADFL
jgi:hypothetical protein